MRAVLYIRVSTDEQAREGYSVTAQIAFLTRIAEELGYTIIEIYIDDGYSAKNMKRPNLQRLLKDAAGHGFDVVLFWRLDRFTRKTRDFHRMAEQLQKHNVGIKSATERYDTTTAMGRFQLELSVSLAQLERETTSERVHFVAEERARKGIRNGGPAPYGYVYVEKELLVNPQEADFVRQVFDLYLDGKGYKKIAHIMGRIPEAQTIKWSGPAVKYILENPVYCGVLRWNYIKSHRKTNNEIIVDVNYEPIIDEVTFKRVQNEIARRKKGGKRFTSEFLFSSVLRCPKCATWMHGFSYEKKGRRYRTYRCGNRTEFGTCDMSNMRESGIIDAFLSALTLDSKEWERYFAVDIKADSEMERQQAARRELDAIARRKKKWHEAFANELITMDELRQYTEEDRVREDELKKQLQPAGTVTKSHWTKEELIVQLTQLRDAWYLIENDHAKKMFIQEAFDSITVDIAKGFVSGQGRKPKMEVVDLRFRQ